MTAAIDIGSFWSRICMQNGEISLSIPSAILISDGEIVIGQSALDNRFSSIGEFIDDFKSRLGLTYPYLFDNIQLTVEDIYQRIFARLKDLAESRVSGLIEKAYITYPATFNDNKKKLLKEAASRAGLPDIQLIAEPLAAVWRYCAGLEVPDNTLFLVYDLGGGTLDLALVRILKGKPDFAAPSYSLEKCGGINIDKLLFTHLSQALTPQLSPELQADPQLWASFRTSLAAESIAAKCRLSFEDSYEGNFRTGDAAFNFTISREELNAIIRPLVEETMTNLRNYLTNENISPGDIGILLPASGTSQIPLVTEHLKRIIPHTATSDGDPVWMSVLGALAWDDPAHPGNIKNSRPEDDNGKEGPACTRCSQPLLQGLTYCPHCGKPIYYRNFITDDMKEAYKKSLEDFATELKSFRTTPAEMLINSTVARYVAAIENIRHISRQPAFEELVSKDLLAEMNIFLDRCVSGEMHIAIIGTIKSGKSTLLNALLGRDLASTHARPETAALTKFRSSMDNNFVRVFFYDAKEWNQLWENVNQRNATGFMESYNNLGAKDLKEKWIGHSDIRETYPNEDQLREAVKRWTSAISPEHFFVKEVEVGLKHFDLPSEVVFVDTPGLDDPVDYRSKVTRDYIRRANVVVACVSAESLTGSELNHIQNVFAHARGQEEKVFVAATKIDAFWDLQHWSQISSTWLDRLAEKSCFNDHKLAKTNLIPVAALLGSILNKYVRNPEGVPDNELHGVLLTVLVKMFGGGTLSDLEDKEKIHRLQRFANIDTLQQRIMIEQVKKSREIMTNDITKEYILLKSSINKDFSLIKESRQEMAESLGSSIESVRKSLDKMQGKLEENRKKKKHLEELFDEFTTELDSRIPQLLEKIRTIKK